MTQMPNDILADLFFGKIVPWEERPDDVDTFHQLNQKMGQSSNALESRLDNETQALLEQYISDRADMESLMTCASFKIGFRLGVQLILAAYKKQ